MEWIKCSEKLPPYGDYYTSKRYLIFCGYQDFAYWYNNRWVENCDDMIARQFHPTHWAEKSGNPEEEDR